MYIYLYVDRYYKFNYPYLNGELSFAKLLIH